MLERGISCESARFARVFSYLAIALLSQRVAESHFPGLWASSGGIFSGSKFWMTHENGMEYFPVVNAWRGQLFSARTAQLLLDLQVIYFMKGLVQHLVTEMWG